MKRRTVKRILTYVRPYRAAFAASCASALLYVLFTLLGPVFTGRAIDNILGPGQVDLRGVLYYLALLGNFGAAGRSQPVGNECLHPQDFPAGRPMICAAKHSAC